MHSTNTSSPRRTRLWTRLLPLLALALPVHASPIVLLPTPDIYLGEVNATYISGEFVAVGSADLFIDMAGQFPITSGTYSLSATIDSSGVATGGALTVNGYMFDEFSNPLYPPSSGLLLQGNLTDFEFAAGPFDTGELTFAFQPIAGDLLPLYPRTAVVKLNFNSGFPGSFSGDFFSFDLANVADVGTVPEPTPEPGTWALFLVGAALCAVKRRRSVNRSL